MTDTVVRRIVVPSTLIQMVHGGTWTTDSVYAHYKGLEFSGNPMKRMVYAVKDGRIVERQLRGFKLMEAKADRMLYAGSHELPAARGVVLLCPGSPDRRQATEFGEGDPMLYARDLYADGALSQINLKMVVPGAEAHIKPLYEALVHDCDALVTAYGFCLTGDLQ